MALLRCLTLAATFLPVAYGLAITRRNVAFDYNGQKVRGVSLGGWFVLEPWITPSIFENRAAGVVDEYTLSRSLGQSAASSLLNNHWNTWITQEDFHEIAALGLNHVRIPIGYWALAPIAGDPYVQGQLQYLDAAVTWARAAGLKILVDLHGGPDSQNGYDNSGRLGPIGWSQGDTIAQTLAALSALAGRYAGDCDVVTAIELLNEPAGYSSSLSLDTIRNFYLSGESTVRAVNPNTAVVIHDAFQNIDSWNGFMNTQSGIQNVILDTHIYQIFSDGQVAMSPSAHIANACSNIAPLKQTDKWTIVGEWSGAQTDCALWLNGYGKGARYDGSFDGSNGGKGYGSCETKTSGTVDGLLDVDKKNLRQFVEAQMDAYEAHTGWIFWAWKNEAAPEWHFQNLTRAGLIPQPLTSRQYPGQCG